MSKQNSTPRLKEVDILSRVSLHEEQFHLLKLKRSSIPSERASSGPKTV